MQPHICLALYSTNSHNPTHKYSHLRTGTSNNSRPEQRVTIFRSLLNIVQNQSIINIRKTYLSHLLLLSANRILQKRAIRRSYHSKAGLQFFEFDDKTSFACLLSDLRNIEMYFDYIRFCVLIRTCHFILVSISFDLIL